MINIISTDSFSNVSARIWNIITTNIDENISFMKFKIVLKLYLHDNKVILKYTKYIFFKEKRNSLDPDGGVCNKWRALCDDLAAN